MSKLKFYYVLPILAFVLIFSSCKDDEDPVNVITITIEEPVDGETIAIANCADVHVHIDIAASIENHEVEIILHPEEDVNDKIIDYDAHEHDSPIEFEQEIDLCSYPSGTCFHLEVFACVDHDCAERTFGEAEFCIE